MTEPEVGNPRWRPPKPEILIFRLVDETETESQRLNLHFRSQAIQWDLGEYCATKPEVEITIWRPQNRKYLYLDL